MKKDNTYIVLLQLIRKLKIQVSETDIFNELEKHPDYPSLLAISDVLGNFNIESDAFRIEADDLKNVPCPFIAHTHLNNGDFVIVNQLKDNQVILSDEKSNRYRMKLQEFKKIFSGIVLTAKPLIIMPASFSFISILNRSKPLFIITSLALVIIMAVIYHTTYFTDYTWQQLLLTVFKGTGVIISILLLIQSIDSNNPLIQKLCKGGGKTDCNEILSSKAAKVFEGLSWSEVGFFYFTATLLITLFGGHSVTIMQILAVLNIISLPYTFYSVYYQGRVAKRWCVLCCTVQALLWLEFIPLVTIAHPPFSSPGATGWTTLGICFLLPVILWVLLKPLLLKTQELAPLKQQLRKFKYNADAFNKMLRDQPKYAMPDYNWSIVLGNAEANNCITMVTNPYCPPCSKMHKILDELLDKRDDIQARIIFNANNTEDDIKAAVCRHMMALNELPDKAIIKKALNDWYAQKQKDYKAWANTYPIQINEANYRKIDQQKTWCEMTEITATPTMLLNGYRMPELYQLPDLKYMFK